MEFQCKANSFPIETSRRTERTTFGATWKSQIHSGVIANLHIFPVSLEKVEIVASTNTEMVKSGVIS